MKTLNPYGSSELNPKLDREINRPAPSPRQPMGWFVAALNVIVVGIVIAAIVGVALGAAALLIANLIG